MAGGPGAAGGPASSALASRPRARRFRVGRAGDGARSRAARCLPRSPAYLGHGAPARRPLQPGRSAAARCRSPARRPWPFGPGQRRKRAGWRAPGVGRRPPSSRGLSRAASAGRGSSPQPAASSHAAPRTSARRTLAARRPAGWIRLPRAGGRGPRAPRPRSGRREGAAPQPPPLAGRGALAARGVCSGARRGPEASWSQAAFPSTPLHTGGRNKAKETGMGGKG